MFYVWKRNRIVDDIIASNNFEWNFIYFMCVTVCVCAVDTLHYTYIQSTHERS